MTATVTTLRAALPRSPSLSIFFDNLDSFADAPEGVAKLRELILDLAVRGKLAEQDEDDEPADLLIERVKGEKADLVRQKKVKQKNRTLFVTLVQGITICRPVGRG